MDGAFSVARSAARKVRKGWLKRGWKEGDRRCMVQAVDDSGYNSVERLFVLQELERQIQPTASYRIINWVAKHRKWDRRQRLTMWNDFPGRRQDQVVSVLEAVADRLEAQARREECQRLESAISHLQSYIADQQAYIQALEEQVVSFWRPRKNHRELAAGQSKLDELRADLAEKRAQLSELNAA